MSQEEADKIFAKIAELADFASREKREIENLFYKEGRDADISGTRLELLKKAQEIIINSFDTIKGEKKPEKIEKLLADLEKSKIEIELLHSVLKSAKEGGEAIDFENIRDLEIETKEIKEDLSEQEKQEILEISRRNYFECVYKDNPEAAEKVLEDLKKELETEEIAKQRKYILKYQGEVIAFCRFKPIEGSETDIYGGSLNVYNDLKAFGIGKYFLEKVLAEEAKKYNIRATCREELFESIYQKQGFEKTGEFEKNGNKHFNILLPKKES